ncbi:Nucleic acid-binding proteins superfamily [Arabidopsis thaliana]|uniref:Nucleic acid-binding proteins superfamily n=1 Tax=Arabidopsis thaliana TaxID=3702 RepID=F4I1M8_ARATH|nr:Nucleic acid-binding proteins superfamily [Arabidopsis thaliana]AEE31866.1 Nucleic acid-binding proteins superfamily [Arabidopsis thaliana]|eukprot:NP_174868.1 Nucleic acid-binding proteins superfamily [Arabidopsis thaliana]
MASILSNSFVYLREINPALDQYKIKVRVVRLWRLFKSIEMVLVDGEGTRVHASIEEGLGKRFQHQFVSGESRIIDTFSFVYYDDVLGQIVDVGSLDSIKAKGKDTVKLSAGSEDLIHVDSENKTSHSAVTLYEEFFQLNEKKTVEDIVYACDVSTCVTIARVCFIETMPKWYYIACKAHGDAGPICSCGVCDADATDLILRASYGASPEVKLLFFDGLAQCLIGKTAAEFFAEVPKESDPSILPEVLADLMGKTMLFKLSIGTDNLKSTKAAYVVEKFWEKTDMVEKFAKELTVVSDSACDIINPKIEMIESSVVDDSPSTDKRIFDDVKSKPVTGKKMVTRKKAKVEKLT